MFISKISTDIKNKTAPLLEPFKKLNFGGSTLGAVSGGAAPNKFRVTKLRLQLNNFTQNLDFDVLWFRRRRAYKI